VSIAQARAELNAIQRSLAEQYPEDRNAYGVEVQPLLEYVSDTNGYRKSLYLLFGAVTAVLLIACANVAGLLLARGFARRHEFSVRVALGAKSAHIIRQVLIESTVLACCGGVIGIGLAFVLLKAVLGLAPAELPRVAQVRIDWIVVAFAFVVSLVTGVAFGVFPAWAASRSDSSGLWRASRNQQRARRTSIARNIRDRGDGDQPCAARGLGSADRQLRGNDARSAGFRSASHSDVSDGHVRGRIS
jgi:predicted lysophospholipase L1 biosynthesis ABC-type transport system permease subunit